MPRRTVRTRSSRTGCEEEGAVGPNPNQHCQACSEEDNSRMVQCDKCDGWYHFECVGVSHDIQVHDWICTRCQAKGAVKKQPSVSKIPPTVSTTVNAKSINASKMPTVNPPVNTNTVTPCTMVPFNTTIHSKTSMQSSLLALPHMVVPSTSVPSTAQIASTLPHPSNTMVTFTVQTPVQSAFAQSNQAPAASMPSGVSSMNNPPLQSMAQLTMSQPTVTAQTFPQPQLAYTLPHPPLPYPFLRYPTLSQPILPHTTLVQSTLPKPTLILPPINTQDHTSHGSVCNSRQSSKATGSRVSTKQTSLRLELEKLEKEREMEENEERSKREYLQKRYTLLKDIATETQSRICVEEEGSLSKVEKWLKNGCNVLQQPLGQQQPIEQQQPFIHQQPLVQQQHPQYTGQQTLPGQHQLLSQHPLQVQQQYHCHQQQQQPIGERQPFSQQPHSDLKTQRDQQQSFGQKEPKVQQQHQQLVDPYQPLSQHPQLDKQQTSEQQQSHVQQHTGQHPHNSKHQYSDRQPTLRYQKLDGKQPFLQQQQESLGRQQPFGPEQFHGRQQPDQHQVYRHQLPLDQHPSYGCHQNRTRPPHLEELQSHGHQEPFVYQRHRLNESAGWNVERTHAPTRVQTYANTNASEFDPLQRSTPRGFTLQSPEAELCDEYNLSRSQVAARQAVSRELPVFSGAPEEWPLFFAAFNTTTNMCGYTAEENLVRLQKSLKGRAYEAIKWRLMHPSNVSGIIATLKMLFGNPEVIVNNLIAKVQTTPAPRADQLDTLIEFALGVQNLCATIEACKLEEYTYNVALLRELVDKLPPSFKIDWAKFRRTLPSANLSVFAAWLYELAETVCPIAALANNDPRTCKNNKRTPSFLNAHAEHENDPITPRAGQESKAAPFHVTAKECVICKTNCSTVEKCKRFIELGYNSRWAAVKEFALCRKCLKKHKGVCKSQQVCGKNGCKFLHHQLLHNYQRDTEASAETEENVTNTQAALQRTTAHDCNPHQDFTKNALFRIAPVVIYGRGKTVHTYAFLDDGSKLTLMDAALARELEFEGKPEPLLLKWTGNKCRLERDSIRFCAELSGTGVNHKKYKLQDVRTVSNLDLFHQSLHMEQLSAQYKHLRGIPAESYNDIQPQILIGIDNANLGYAMKGREGKMQEPIATKTRLGWIVHGGSESTSDGYIGHHNFSSCQCSKQDDSLQKALQDYFTLESMGISKSETPILSQEDRRAQDILQSAFKTENGHYETRLLWKYNEFRLPNSKPQALQRFRCLEARMKREPALATTLKMKIDDYLQKGYIRKLKEEELKETHRRMWYLPIFPVFNPNKPGKVRIVWDAAAEVQGLSLNSMLLKGPDQLTSLVSVLYKFRENRIAICGDIREMFHQVLIAKEDQHCQRFLWRDNPNEEPSVYVMQVMTFGACCSPSSAQYVKNVNASRHADQYPKAAEAIIKKHYVDDMLASVETVEEAIQLAHDVRYVHAQAGFDMRNWISNSCAVLESMEEKGTHEKSLNLGSQMATEKVLGMWWCTATDTFTYKLSPKHDDDLLCGKRKPTKREVLRTLMSIFDPLGLISNFLIFLKVLLQEIWRSAIGWDDEIPKHLYDKWERWISILPKVQNVSIPRCYRSGIALGPHTTVQMHTFVDASESGYAAVVYLRFQEGDNIECSIVAAKSRVAPLKLTSIPRLELQAAVVGARLADSITRCLSFEVNEHFFWTDSRDSLCWIVSEDRLYSLYVEHRTTEIRDTTKINSWRWVSSKENVADEATKWQRNPDLRSNSRWFKGPEFLWQNRHEWPVQASNIYQTKEELRAHAVSFHDTKSEPIINAERFSNWKRLLHAVAYVYRFPSNIKLKCNAAPLDVGPFSSEELKQAKVHLLRQAQQDGFPEELHILSKTGATNKDLPKSSPIFRLSPFLDDQRLMRMHGRIGKCKYASMDAKNPIILPKNHRISMLIVRDFHEHYNHRNHETIINEVRQVYCISNLRVMYGRVHAECQTCKNFEATPQPPPMADLPSARLAAYTRPFSFIGIDYFGPFYVKVRRSTEKRWGVLITCLTIRAIHLEVAHTLNADSCIMALRKFMARRGVPIHIYSDRGTNFTAASKELEEALEAMDQNKVMREIISPETGWSFNPPASPHMGGSWERLVQTVKMNLKHVNIDRQPTDEVLQNVLTEIENVVNSRPLTYVSVEDPTAPVLTPNHFLLGSSSGLKPVTLLDDKAMMLRRLWRASQVEANLFWERWLRDYLPEITTRTKWHTEVKPVGVDDIVVIVDPTLPRNCWPKGRVISVNRSGDGQVRSAAVQTAAGGIYERPVVSLAVLDVRREVQVNQEQVPGVPGGSVTTPRSARLTLATADRTPIDRERPKR